MAINPHQSIRGSYYTFTAYSGLVSAGDVVVTVSGQNRGRLNTVMIFNVGTSGVAATFYDGANAGVTLASGGPYLTSGHIPLYQIPTFPNGAQILASGSFPYYSTVFNVDQPFFSGLNIGVRSGGPAFTLGYTVEKLVF